MTGAQPWPLARRVQVLAARGYAPTAIAARLLVRYQTIAPLLAPSPLVGEGRGEGAAPTKPAAPVDAAPPPHPAASPSPTRGEGEAALPAGDTVHRLARQAAVYLRSRGLTVGRAAGSWWIGDRELTDEQIIARANKTRARRGEPLFQEAG